MTSPNTDGAVSLKILAERKCEGFGTSKGFKVCPTLLEFEPGFNARPIDLEHVAEMKASFINGMNFPPIDVRVDNGRVIVIDGHHRVTMYKELIAEGFEIEPVDCTQFRGNDAERVVMMVGRAGGKPLTPLQMGEQYRILENFGWSVQKISEKIGKNAQNIAQMIQLAQANTDVKDLVNSNQISATNAVKFVQTHGERAGAAIKEAVTIAKIEGKTKVTAKQMPKKPSAANLVDAINIEMLGGARAEVTCPHYAALIAHLRGTSK